MIEYLAAHQPTLTHWLVLANLLFAIGIFGLLCRRNAIGILMAAELMLNAAAMTLVIFNRHIAPATVDGQIMALFVIAVAAAEAVVALAIFVAIFRYRATVDPTNLNLLKN